MTLISKARCSLCFHLSPYHFLPGDNILTAISVGRDCGLIKPDQTVIRVEAELGGGQYMPNLNVSYTLEEKSNIVRDVS